jgi:hypothetical protein
MMVKNGTVGVNIRENPLALPARSSIEARLRPTRSPRGMGKGLALARKQGLPARGSLVWLHQSSGIGIPSQQVWQSSAKDEIHPRSLLNSPK